MGRMFPHANGRRGGGEICLAKHTHLPFQWLIGAPDQVRPELESFG